MAATSATPPTPATPATPAAPAAPAAPATPRLQYYHWRAGYEHLMAQKELPWKNVWVNDQAVFYYNIPVVKKVGGIVEKPPTNLRSWMRDLLDGPNVPTDSGGPGLRTNWANYIQLKKPEVYINSEFLKAKFHTSYTNLYVPDQPAFGIVSQETAAQIQSSMGPVMILCPTKVDLETYRLKIKGPPQRGAYASLRGTPKDITENDARKITRWTTKAETIASVSSNTDPSNCISICFSFVNNGQRSLFTGDHAGQRIREGLGVSESSQAYSTWDLLKV